MALLLQLAHPRQTLGQQLSVEISRYATEIKVVDEQTAEVSVNLNIPVYQAEQQPNLYVTLPRSEGVVFRSNRIRITDSRGNVLRKQNMDKKALTHSVNLNLSGPPLTESAAYPLTVEWEFRVVLIAPSGGYSWPAVTGNYSIIKYLGIRLFADNELLRATLSNIESSAKLIDQSTGMSGMVWDITGFDSKRAWQKAKPIDNPSVKITF